MVSTIATGMMWLVGVSLIYVLYRTIKGHPIERRIVFLYIALAIILPLLMQKTAPITVTSNVQQLVDALDKLQPGSKVLAAFDYDPSSAPELQPMGVAFMKYAFKHDLKVIVMGLWPQGPQQANQAIEEAMKDPEIAAKNLQYGVDYVNLGYQSGAEFVIQSMGSDFKQMFPLDDRHIQYDSLQILDDVTNFSNIDFIFNLSAGKPGTVEWIQIAVDRFGATCGGGNTAVQAPQVYPYLRSGQLTGLLGGMSGGAEFEKAINEKGQASTFIFAQMISHAMVIAFIIMGNIAFFMTRKKKKA